jgi:hypothetical protein
MLAGRLVSLFVDPLVKSGLLGTLLDDCWRFPNASMLHQIIIGGALVPMIQACTPIVADELDDVYAPAGRSVLACVSHLKLWNRILDDHFAYDEETEERRNRFAFNGLLTQLANALVNSSCPMEDARVMQFVASKLDWVNTLENTPLTATVYSKKTRPNDDDVESDDEEHEPENGSEEDPEPVVCTPTRALGKSRVDVLNVSNPKPVGDYSSPPRPRLPQLTAKEDKKEEGAQQEKTKQEQEEEEEVYNEHSFWRVPIQEF